MTENQAEKLAETAANEIWKLWFEGTVDRYRTDDLPTVSRFTGIVSKAITQATAELREDNEQLKAQVRNSSDTDFHNTVVQSMNEELRTLKAEVERLKNVPMPSSRQILKCETCKPFYREFIAGDNAKVAEIRRLETELAQAQSQVAGLVDALAFYNEPSNFAICSYGESEDEIRIKTLEPQEVIEYYGFAKNGDFGIKAIETLENTQATADAFRAKVREEAVRECITELEDIACDYDASGGPSIVLLSEATEKLQALISDKKGGTQ